ncbi:hypothetical protein EVAR_28370_1 [Eumeta japonica]|uniref:Uncharacterized protein n=1 Tax=Eumeta variegata TaxID=151549 RepID=A0A4C1ZUL2_EUMVA|nr:hypothetical protein EVAR_28370_1 [Eumeta japonica]
MRCSTPNRTRAFTLRRLLPAAAGRRRRPHTAQLAISSRVRYSLITQALFGACRRRPWRVQLPLANEMLTHNSLNVTSVFGLSRRTRRYIGEST